MLKFVENALHQVGDQEDLAHIRELALRLRDAWFGGDDVLALTLLGELEDAMRAAGLDSSCCRAP